MKDEILICAFLLIYYRDCKVTQLGWNCQRRFEEFVWHFANLCRILVHRNQFRAVWIFLFLYQWANMVQKMSTWNFSTRRTNQFHLRLVENILCLARCWHFSIWLWLADACSINPVEDNNLIRGVGPGLTWILWENNKLKSEMLVDQA